MSPWRGRARKALFQRKVTLVVARFPLEAGLVGWGFFAIISLLTRSTMSNALTSLPGLLEELWAVLMGIASLTVLAGLIGRRLATVATGMYLYGTILGAYSVAIVGASGWHRGGAIAGFLMIIGMVCFLRGWWLKESEHALVEEITRQQHEEL